MSWRKGVALAGFVVLAAGLTACGAKKIAAAQGTDTQPAAAAPASIGPQDPNNVLIGQWRYSSSMNANNDIGGCPTAVTFTSTAITQTAMGSTSTIPVRYNASPTTVYVLTDTGLSGHVTYKVLDPNHVQIDAYPACTFERVG